MRYFFAKYIDKQNVLCYTFFAKPDYSERIFRMILYEELYFEITLTGKKSDLKKFANYAKSGELDDFFEFSSDFISYADNFDEVGPEEESEIVISNDDYGIEIDEFDTDEFLEALCKAARALDVRGHLYDIDDEEYRFISEAGDSYYLNAKNIFFDDEEEE